MSEQSFSPALESVFAAGDVVDEMNAEAGIVVQTDSRPAPVAEDDATVSRTYPSLAGQGTHLHFGALPAATEDEAIRIMPSDLKTLLYWARHGADDIRNQIIDQIVRNIAST